MGKDKSTNQNGLTGEDDDNWLTGVKNCNAANCDQYAKMAFEVARKITDIKR